jgi:hypothetical protein
VAPQDFGTHQLPGFIVRVRQALRPHGEGPGVVVGGAVQCGDGEVRVAGFGEVLERVSPLASVALISVPLLKTSLHWELGEKLKANARDGTSQVRPSRCCRAPHVSPRNFMGRAIA